LQPTFLGDVTVSVKVDHGEVTARLEASTPVVREWLDANQGWLRDRLADQNLTLSRLDIAAPANERLSSDRRDAGSEQHAPENNDSQSQPRRQQTSDSDETFELLA
jgi:flagellar hook-length control protein FliK